MEPEMEAQIERVLVLGDQPVMRRPIAAASVLAALTKARKYDPALCARVERYLQRFMHTEGIARASVEGAVANGGGASSVIPDRYGMQENSHWNVSGQGYAQLSDYVLVNAGVNAYEGRTDFTGSMISLGGSYMQLDLGFRPHWFSPMSDSSMLMSTEASTMPSATLSNYEGFTPFDIHYELFAALMSRSDRIVLGDGLVSGRPRLTGIHMDVEPATGWSLGLNRLYQYGGGAAGSGSWLHGLKSLVEPNAGHQTGIVSQQIGNQEASITSNLLFPGRVPFSVYFEYAGEDTSRGKPYLFGNAALSAGIHFPRLFRHFDLTLETTEWQNGWYVHTVYLDGLVNNGRVIGNWFGDQRVFADGVGGHSAMARLGYDAPFGGQFQLQYRTLANEQYFGNHYQHYQDVSLGYSRPWHGVVVGGEVGGGKDVFGSSFSRLSGFIRYDEGGSLATAIANTLDDDGDQPVMNNGEVFVEVGATNNRQRVDLTPAVSRTTSPYRYGAHFGVGARRFVSDNSDLGARVEFDNIQGHSLIGARILDYRYRFHGPLALGFFLGAARYDLATPAYGFYLGAGIQWRNLFPGWDLGVDYRYADNVARDHLLPSDPPNVGDRNDSFYNISIFTLALSRHF
jgi:hypothetical protein